MRSKNVVLGTAFLVVAAFLFHSFPRAALAAPVGQFAAAKYGAVQLQAGVATRIPNAKSLQDRTTILIQNRGSGSIYCGWDNSVTVANGWEIVAGGTLSVNTSYSQKTDSNVFWCIAASTQTSPADTRWMEVR